MNLFFNGELKDFGDEPAVLELKNLATINNNYRTSLWTGKHLQVTVMSIESGGDIGAEIHENLDQMIYIVSGRAAVIMGEDKDNLSIKTYADPGDAVFIPSGTYHNVINASFYPLKVFSVYAPPAHRLDTVEPTKPEE